MADDNSDQDDERELLDPPTGIDATGSGDPSDPTVISPDELSSPASAVVRELLTAPTPVTAADVADMTNTDVEAVKDFAGTLALFGYILTDSRAPSLDADARFIANPIVGWATKATTIVRHVNDSREIESAIRRHDTQLEDLRAETGFESAEAFNTAVFDDESQVVETEQNKTLAMQWILTEEQRDTLVRVRDQYDYFTSRLEALEESEGFIPESVNPPATEQERYLEPPQPPFL